MTVNALRHYASNPAFTNAVYSLYTKREAEDLSALDVARFYSVWLDGESMGRYCELTKGATCE